MFDAPPFLSGNDLPSVAKGDSKFSGQIDYPCLTRSISGSQFFDCSV